MLTFDLEGRLYVAFLEGRTFQRGLDGRVLLKGRRPDGPRGERWCRELEAAERLDLYRTVHGRVREAWAAHMREAASVMDGDWERATVLLSRVLRWTPDRLEEERARFRSAYLPVGILPPDQYLSILLQATEGCSWNRCAFCPFYRGRPYRFKTVDEFGAHLRAVRRFLGEGVRLRRSLFMGEANALALPQRHLLRLFEMAREEFPDQGEIHAFMDIFSLRKSGEEVRALGARGLRRVVIGLETGCDDLLALIRKPGSADRALRAVETLKDAGIGIGVVVLLGIGGERYFDDHVRDTLRAVDRMGLGEGDIVYFSPLVELSGAEYFERAAALGIRRLGADEVAAQETLIRDGLRFAGPPPTLARYDVSGFVY